MLSLPHYKLIWDDGKSREYEIIREITSGNGRRIDNDDNIGGVGNVGSVGGRKRREIFGSLVIISIGSIGVGVDFVEIEHFKKIKSLNWNVTTHFKNQELYWVIRSATTTNRYKDLIDYDEEEINILCDFYETKKSESSRKSENTINTGMATTSNQLINMAVNNSQSMFNADINDIEVEIEYEFLVPKSLRRGPIKIL
nr:14399_t:CDS:2 [Entrophospora candida]